MARTVRKRKRKPWAGIPKPVSKPKEVSESKKATSTPKKATSTPKGQVSKTKQTGKSKRSPGSRGKLGVRPKGKGRRRRTTGEYVQDLRSCIRAGYAALPGGSSAHATGSAEKLAVREGCRKGGKKG